MAVVLALFVAFVVYSFLSNPPEWQESTGDDHEFQVTVKWSKWEKHRVHLIMWYGDAPYSGTPDGTATWYEGPGTISGFVPHAQGQTEVSLAAVWLATGVPELPNISGVFAPARDNPFVIDGAGPTRVFIDMDRDTDPSIYRSKK